MEYQELIKVIRDELESSDLIARVENDDIPSIDLKKRSLYPLAAFYIDSVEITNSVNTFTVQLLVADILDVNKQTNQDNQDFIWNQSLAVINNFYSKLNRGVLSSQLIEDLDPITLTPFTDRLDKGLAGMETTLSISVRNNMDLCIYPFEFAANGITIVLKSGYGAGATGKIYGDPSGRTFTAVNEAQLRALSVNSFDYTSVCTTLVTNMSGLFDTASTFNQSINTWDVSNVTNMRTMFIRADSFNQPLNNWDVSSVTDMQFMFSSANVFNQPLNSWNVSNVTDMGVMFNSALAFNQPLNSWNVANVTNMDDMFNNSEAYNQDLSGWCVTNIGTQPSNFDLNATDWLLPNSRPIWGTCP